MKLLNTTPTPTNAKLAKAAGLDIGENYRFASLSMMPDAKLCPASKAAGCRAGCLESAGRGRMASVIKARKAKADYFHADAEGFVLQLMGELEAFDKLCAKQGKTGAVRLNVLSDVAWESLFSLARFSHLKFYDYTKRAGRLDSVFLPSNYHLTFSYSGRPEYQRQVDKALKTDRNIAVVFRGPLPFEYLGRRVIDGDKHDLRFLDPAGVVVGLKAKGKAKLDTTGFVVDVCGDD